MDGWMSGGHEDPLITGTFDEGKGGTRHCRAMNPSAADLH